MEIIHVVLGKANPDRMNGVNKVVYQLASKQKAAGRNVSVWGITPSTEHNYGDRNFETRLFRAYRNPFQVDPAMLRAFREVSEDAVVHLHGGWIPVFATLARALNNLGIRYVLTPHGAYNKVAMERSRIRKMFYFRLFEKQVIRFAHRIHCIGQSEVTGLNDLFPNDKSFLLPYGFEGIPTVVQRRVMPRGFVIGFVGRLDIHTKGIDLLLKAYRAFREQYPLSKLWIVGDGPGRAKLEKYIVSTFMDSSVILWGSKFGEDKIHLMNKMDVFVHPSRNEGMPAAVLEAASMGIPCIVSEATNIGGYVNQYDAGIVIPNEDTDALTEALRTMYRHKEENTAAAMALGSRQMVSDVFNWNKILEQFGKLYEQ